MELASLVARIRQRSPALDVEVVGDPHVDVTAISHDSRRASDGTLHCCVVGAVHDGHDFAPGVVAAGASALLCERHLDLGVPELVVASVRHAMGPVAAALYDFPSDHLDVIGVTGTNGKTTTTMLLASILDHDGRSCGLIGTLTGARTTPEATELQATLASMRAEGRAAVAIEVSSHALDLARVDGTRFRVGVFTNLSRDHLDHHGTMEAYFAAKSRLFTPDRCEVAVVNLDDAHGRRLAASVEVPVLGFTLDDAEDLQLHADRSTFRWRGADVVVHLPGRFNVVNALAAATAAAALGVHPTSVARGLAHAEQVDGRFERVDAGQPFLAVVDYAHTPDGLRSLLEAGREVVDGRVIVVFGAGGDRDPSKRPEMGAAAEALADVVVLTNDNPRSEDPAAIIDAVVAGMHEPARVRIEPDRAAAIEIGVSEARPGDVVLVAGKGHETTQLVGETTTDFDDRVEVRRALARHGWTMAEEVDR